MTDATVDKQSSDENRYTDIDQDGPEHVVIGSRKV